MARLISRALFARQCGVSKPAITLACKGKLKPACVADRIDVDHQAARTYMAAKNVTLGEVTSARAPTSRTKPSRTGAGAKPARGKPSRVATPSPPAGRRAPEVPDGVAPPGSDADLGQLESVLHPLLDRFGTSTAFKDWLAALKDIEAIREKRLKNAETEGRLISRDLVKGHVFGAIESAFKRLLGDASKTIASKVRSSTQAGGTLEEAERIARDNMGSQLKALKATAIRNLKRKRKPDGTQSDSDG